MDDTLQRLLDAEMRAEQIARQAEAEREHIIQGALLEARAEEDRFETRIPELHAAFIEKAEARAEQTVAELKRTLADEREDEALAAAFTLLIDVEADNH